MTVENSEGDTPAECTSHNEVIRLLREADEAKGRSPARNTEGEWVGEWVSGWVKVCCVTLQS